MFYDAKEVENVADIEQVACSLGLSVKRRGKVKMILCPCHLSILGKTDTKHGSCVLYEDSYYCFACQHGGNVFEMVEMQMGCSFPDAVNYVVEVCGLANSFHTTKKKRSKKEFPLTSTDLELLGLKSSTYSDSVANQLKYQDESFDQEKYKLADKKVFPQQDNDILCDRTPGYSLYQFYQEDKECFKEMLLGKIEEATKKREKLKGNLEKKPEMYTDAGIHILFHEGIREALDKELSRLKELKLWCLRIQVPADANNQPQYA